MRTPGENSPISKRTVGFGIALAIACLVNALLVVVKEKSDTLMNAMKRVAGHHWTTHSLFILALFLAGGALLTTVKGRRLEMSGRRLITLLACAAGTATAVIVGFYLFLD